MLFIAAEDANGVAKTRLPAACKARGIKLADIDAHWRTETETFDLLCESDRGEMIQAYREFAPDLIFIDVLTRVVAADINAPETGMRVMQGTSLRTKDCRSCRSTPSEGVEVAVEAMSKPPTSTGEREVSSVQLDSKVPEPRGIVQPASAHG